MTELRKPKSVHVQEWSHYIFSEDIDRKPLRVNISVSESDISDLCKRLNLHSIKDLQAQIVLTRNPISKVIHIEGALKADLCQYCIVTLEPVSECVEDNFEAWFTEPNEAVSFTKAKRDRMNPQEKSEQPMLEEQDDPEKIVDGKIDLGELVTQHLSLSLNPYPRAEGTEFENQEEHLKDGEDDVYKNPFAILKEWKKSEKKKD